MKYFMQTRWAASVVFWSSVVALLLATALPTPAVSCDTPVCRYAMYNWPRSPFYVVYFHQGEISEEDAAANKLLEEMGEVGPAGANLAFKAIDVTDEEQLKQIPEFFNEARKELVKGTDPTHMIFPPWYTDPMVERLDEAAVKNLADSPMRQQIGELFNEGNSSILMILTGPDEEANAKAEKVAAEVVKAAATGEVPMAEDADEYYEEPTSEEDAAADDEADTEADQEEEEEAEPRLKVAVLKVARTDPAEQWLVRTLLSVESDLRDSEFEKDAMVFAIYGRGRAMPPYVGKGITTDNLIECVAFLAGPCSCMVKDQNPGVDLLTTWDWDATAEIIARDDPSLNPDPWDYQEYAQNDEGDWSEAESTDPEPADTAMTEPPVMAMSPTITTHATETVADGSPTEDTPTEDPPAEETPATTAVTESPNEDVPGDDAAEAEAQVAEESSAAGKLDARATEEDRAQSFASRQAWVLGLGLAAGALLVVVVGLAMTGRKQS
ncbi:MAG: hypothetical protein V3R99_04235 [Thermoguttaceae bacterium]